VEQRPAVIEIQKKVVVNNKEVIKNVAIRVDKQVAKVIEVQAAAGSVRRFVSFVSCSYRLIGSSREIRARDCSQGHCPSACDQRRYVRFEVSGMT
jgi:hypothetical protein